MSHIINSIFCCPFTLYFTKYLFVLNYTMNFDSRYHHRLGVVRGRRREKCGGVILEERRKEGMSEKNSQERVARQTQ